MDIIHYLCSSVPICLILVVIRYATAAEDKKGPEKKEELRLLQFHKVRMSGTAAELHWRGLALSSIDHCEYSKGENQSSRINITFSGKPNNFTLRLTDLKPSTSYSVILVCYDITGQVYKSHAVNFTTSADKNFSSSSTSSNPQHTFPYTLWPTTASTVEAYRRRFTPERSPTELGLGVAFGLIGAGVFGVVGYYVIKEYRRRIRIRRFLQYRRHENETFPDLADPEDEPVDEGIGL